MVLDIDRFQEEKGGNPEELRENQRKRYKDPKLVDKVIEADTAWRRCRFYGDLYNRLKNVCSKEIGEKMKKKENQGTDDSLLDGLIDDLEALKAEQLKTQTVVQMKKIRQVVDERMSLNNEAMLEKEKERHSASVEIGNIVHHSVVIHNDEDFNRTERTWGDVTKKRFIEKVFSCRFGCDG